MKTYCSRTCLLLNLRYFYKDWESKYPSKASYKLAEFVVFFLELGMDRGWKENGRVDILFSSLKFSFKNLSMQ